MGKQLTCARRSLFVPPNSYLIAIAPSFRSPKAPVSVGANDQRRDGFGILTMECSRFLFFFFVFGWELIAICLPFPGSVQLREIKIHWKLDVDRTLMGRILREGGDFGGLNCERGEVPIMHANDFAAEC